MPEDLIFFCFQQDRTTGLTHIPGTPRAIFSTAGVNRVIVLEMEEKREI